MMKQKGEGKYGYKTCEDGSVRSALELYHQNILIWIQSRSYAFGHTNNQALKSANSTHLKKITLSVTYQRT